MENHSNEVETDARRDKKASWFHFFFSLNLFCISWQYAKHTHFWMVFILATILSFQIHKTRLFKKIYVESGFVFLFFIRFFVLFSVWSLARHWLEDKTWCSFMYLLVYLQRKSVSNRIGDILLSVSFRIKWCTIVYASSASYSILFLGRNVFHLVGKYVSKFEQVRSNNGKCKFYSFSSVFFPRSIHCLLLLLLFAVFDRSTFVEFTSPLALRDRVIVVSFIFWQFRHCLMRVIWSNQRNR